MRRAGDLDALQLVEKNHGVGFGHRARIYSTGVGVTGPDATIPAVMPEATLTPQERTVRDAADKFQAHLDACKRCAERPFDLCKAGAELLSAVGTAYRGKLSGRRGR